MRNRWEEAKRFDGPLDECVYGSRLLGSDPALVLHGGGNTSVKTVETDVFGRSVDTLWVKGSGWDLATIEAAGFAPLDLHRTRELARLPELSDTAMMRELRRSLLDPTAPNPSVESILHAVIPDPAVQHSHADAIVAITNTARGAEAIREALSGIVVVPYVMPGFLLARACLEVLERDRDADTVGMVLLNHGIFTWGETTRVAYDRMIDLVGAAEEYLARFRPEPPAPPPPSPFDPVAFAELRTEVSSAAGRPMIVTRRADERSRAFAARPDLARVATRGPATPDHVLWTKRIPLVGRDVARYVEEYAAYFERNRDGRDLTRLDPAPRVIVDPELGVVTVGVDAAASDRVGDIYAHTIWVIESAEALGGYEALGEREIFDVEYWELEQAKLARFGGHRAFTGEVALVTGAASGIGRACATALLEAGAAVVGVDVAEEVEDVVSGPAYLGVVADLTDREATVAAVDAAVERFGGIDMLVAAAGAFPSSSPIAEFDEAAWRRGMEVNAEALARLFGIVHPFLARAPRGGRVVVVGSKNVPAPGPGAVAYSASKAAANQVVRVAALEWAADGIRVNTVHPDAVFDTGLWTEALIAERAARYGMTPEEYKTRNLLGTEITSARVAELVVALLGEAFAATTGAQVPIDGGNERVI
ncbi:MAG TPA: bifunctional aldolase/short-chain dehydrogenase [Actinobacteria bacterium]|nr:bifunctional aldolase/short-chain dehydrogenase [Actinomycetota bacterium]